MSGVDTESMESPYRWGFGTVAGAVALVATVTLLLGLAPASPDLARSVEPAMRVVHQFKIPRAVTFAAVGDSITAQSYQGSRYVWQSWVLSANQEGRTEFVAGGYAVPGRTTVDMLAGTVPLDVDVLVFQGAVNDVNLHYPHPEILQRITQIVATVGAPDVVVAALPPNDRYPADALTFNTELAAHAATQGWTFIDPWVEYRNPDGTYLPGAAWDDLHPVEAAAIAAGHTISDAIRAVASGQKVIQ